MDNILAFLAKLKKKQISISLDDSFENLRVRGNLKQLTSSDRQEITDNKTDLISFLKAQILVSQTIVPVDKQDSYSISDAQRRLWVLSQFEDASVAYNMSGNIYLKQGIDVDAFKRAINATIERHEILRTVFKIDETGEVRQVILTLEDLGFKIEYKDFKSEENKDESVKHYIGNDALKAFDLEKGPILRASLLQVGSEEYVFYYNMHHIISDGWSMNVLIKDLFAYYEAYKENNTPEQIAEDIKPLTIQYKDYSAWQLSQFNEDAFKKHKAYWLDILSKELPVLTLLGSKPRPQVKTHNGKTVVTYLNKDLTNALKDYALKRKGTFFMSIVSVLKALLYKYTGQHDIIIGTPVAGRNHPDLENQIGFYVNTLVLRTSVHKTNSFEEIYQKVRNTIIEANAHQTYPFDRLVEDLEQNRLTSRSAIFDILVVLQNTGDKTRDAILSQEEIDAITEYESGTCIYDIKFDFCEEGHYLRLLIEYNTDVYEKETIEQLIRHFKLLVALGTSNPLTPIESIDYLTEEEKQSNLVVLDEFKTRTFDEKTVTEVFQSQVKEYKHNLALVYKDTAFTYQELDERSNQIANFLLNEVRLEKEEKVALLLNRGVDTIAAMLGVLKVGGAYVPMNPKLSEEQLMFMVSDTAARVMITEKEFIEPANRLQWSSTNLKHYLCTDVDDVRSEREHHVNVMRSQDLWDYVGESTADQITGGGWLSSYTGMAIPDVEMEEYRMNVYAKLKNSLHTGMRVLEIGCSSGLTLSKIAPEVSFYYGTDLSPVILSKTTKLIAQKGLKNVKLKQMAAHDISKIEECDFDIIIVNSVIQNFDGHNYLLKVIRDCIGLLKKEGRIFIGDVMDLNKKNDLIEDLEAFKKDNKDENYVTKTDFSADLFVSRGYFEDLVMDEAAVVSTIISEKIRTIENELTKFRYDVILHVNKERPKKENDVLTKHKYQYGRIALNNQPLTNPTINVAADYLACTIYDFETLDKPREIAVKHTDIVKLLNTKNPFYDFSSTDVWTNIYANESDVSLLEIYGALLTGAKVVIVPTPIIQDTDLYLSLLLNEKVTVLNHTPIDFYNLIKYIKADTSLQVRCVIFNGGRANSSKTESWQLQYPSCKLVNIHEIADMSFCSQYKALSQEEEHELLHTFNDTRVNYPKEKTIVDLFEAQVKETPNSPAVAFENKELTYKELEEQSNQLAHYLQTNYHIQPDDLIGMKLERSEWLMITILGILKSGAAYVPIDPSYPKERIEYMEKDINCKVCIDEELLNKFKENQIEYSKSKAPSSIKSDNLAYVIYTSGSTGNPKGVLVEHTGVVNRLLWMRRDLNLVAQDIFLQKTPTTFDVSVWELFLPLLIGSKLVVALPNGHKDPSYLEELIINHKVSIIHFVPSMLSAMLENIDWLKLTTLRHVVCSGEALQKSLVDEFGERTGSIELHNYYGPTEASVDVTAVNLTKYPGKGKFVTIGKPVDNTVVYIVNELNKLQPQGVIGEILLGGVQIARGYLNKSELTAEKFISSPFRKDDRLYKTGDLGRWTEDGHIEFIGRKDNQVKIRGHRIELGEVEHALLKNKEVEEVVVLARENQSKERELVAYIIAKTKQNASELRSYLEQSLPDYMIPDYFVQLESFPLNSNGKIDRKSLPDPQEMGMANGVKYVAPRNKLEEQLVSIWQKVLVRENIGVKDSFFALGGHSIKAVRLGNEYEKALSVKLSLKDLFAHINIESQARLIRNSKKKQFSQIEKTSHQKSYAISDAQRRLWVLSQFEGASIAYNLPDTIRLEQDIDINSFMKALESAIERHEILRTIFKEDETGEIRQWILEKEDFGFKIDYKDLRQEKEKEVQAANYIAADAYRKFDLEKGPLLRAALLQVDEKRYIFYFNIHHIISDGWSSEVLTKDVLAYYEAYKKGKAPKLKPLRIQYKDYSAWQLTQLKEESFQVHRTFWLDILKGELPLLDLPSTLQRPKMKTSNGSGLDAYVDRATTAKLKTYAEEHGGSLFIGLLTAWNILMYRYTSQTDLIIGTSVAAREHADLENQIGFYSNTLALRNEVNPNESFDGFYKTVKENTLKSYNHQMYPFIRLAEELNFKRDASRNGIFDVMLFLLNTGEKIVGVELDEKTINSIEDTGYRASKFDLNIGLFEVSNCVSLQVVYNTDVYDKKMITVLIKHFKQLLHAVMENPKEQIAQLNFLSVDENETLLKTFNTSEISYPSEKTVVELFEAQAVKTPNHTAVVFKDKHLSYKELDELSNRLAHYLRTTYEIKPDDLIGIQLHRSEWLIVSILGILKAGGAYVPIDPEDPSSRKDFILKDASLKVLITEVNFIHDIDYYDGNIFAIDVEFDAENYSPEKCPRITQPHNLAYVIYTSGSTGKPKGVMISSKSLVDYSFGVLSKTNMRECATFGLISTIAADLGNTVIYTSLLIGASLHILAKEDIIQVNKLRAANLDCLKITPSHWKALQADEEVYIPNKCLILGGEQFPEEIVEYMKVGKITCNVYNHYGPTETTIGKLIKHIDITEKDFKLSLGKPFGNNQVYILNTEQRLCPIGITGEICIAGDGLAKGYLNQDELTRVKFIKNPFKEGTHVYKTGDQGRWLTDGSIEFMGRKDDQVKVRGYRIELGEIEQALLKHKQIEEAVVIAKDNQNKEKELIAYYISSTEQNTSEIKSFLKETLPEYMLPAYFVQLEKMPITTNGKIDRKLLPDVNEHSVSNAVEYVAPRNKIEEKIVEAITDILGKPKDHIGIFDNFFDLGMSSLGLIKLYTSINKELKSNLNAVSVFEFSNVATLTEYIHNKSSGIVETESENNISNEMDEIIDLM